MGVASRMLLGGGGGGGGLHGRQPSSTTIASSVSGAGTPDIPEHFPYLRNSAASSSPRLLGEDFGYTDDYQQRRYPQFSPSERSAFSRLPAALEDDEEEEEAGGRVGHSRQRLFEGSLGVGGPSYQTPQLPVASSLSPVEALWDRQRNLAERSTLAETDEETGQEDDEVVGGDRFHYRRGSLPVHPLPQFYGGGPPGRWNFKMRAMPLPVGRVSPLMSDHEYGGRGGGRGGGKKLASQRSVDGVGNSRAATGTPPNKPSSILEDVRLQTSQTKEASRQLSESGGKRDDEETEEEEEMEIVSDEEEEEGGGVGETGLQNWEGDAENGAKAVHVENTAPSSFPLVPAEPLPKFPSPSSYPTKNTTSTSTPNSLSRPKPVGITSRTKQRAPSVPALPTSLLTSSPSVDPPGLPECLGDYERTLHNARNYMREFKALAESGSSDQESDPEPTLSNRLKAVELMEQISSAAKVPALIHHHLVTLHKESKETDLGFSLSDGLGEPGVYVKSIHAGGLAEKNGQLRTFDRIMKVCEPHLVYICCCGPATTSI